MRKTLAFILSGIMLLGAIGSFALAVQEGQGALVQENIASEQLRQTNPGRTLIDTDGSDGYDGDYVVIYNPSTSSGGISTGSLSGLIETTVEEPFDFGEQETKNEDGFINEDLKSKPYEIPFHPDEDDDNELQEYDFKNLTPMDYNVGDTHTFSIMHYSTNQQMNILFECLAVGEYCYVWTPVSAANNMHPLDQIDESFGTTAAIEFDSKYPLMEDAFGTFQDPQGDGRVNLMYYNIDDGWTPGNGYVAGFFYSLDLYYNNAAMINIDTYPLIEWETVDGEYMVDLEGSYNVTMHELQHLINYSQSSSASIWLNEMKSAAAEEIVYPGSSVSSRIRSWLGTSYVRLTDEDANITGMYTAKEYEASSDLHTGATLYQWDDGNANIYYTYAQFSLLAQYLYSQAGTNTIFRAMSNAVASGYDSITAISRGMQNTPLEGMSTSQIIQNFRVALVANDFVSNGGTYGFKHQDGYDPAEYYNMDNLFELLSPCVFVGASAHIQGGGAIVVKPVNNHFTPPQNASSELVYIGVTTDSAMQGGASPVQPTPPPPSGAAYMYRLEDDVTPGETYVIVADSQYAMVDVFSGSELASIEVNISGDQLVGDIDENALWQFDLHTQGSNYSIMSVTDQKYLGSTSSGYPTLEDNVPSYAFAYDTTTNYIHIPTGSPSNTFRYLQGDSGGFEYYGVGRASSISLYRRITLDPDRVHDVDIWPEQPPVLFVNDTYTLTAIVAPSTALNQNVAWTSSNTSVAAVDENGVVTGLAAGTTVITVTTDDGGYTDTVDIQVVQPIEGAVLSIDIEHPQSTPEFVETELRAVFSPADYDPQVVADVDWYVISGFAEITPDANDPKLAKLYAFATGSALIGVSVTNSDGTVCSASSVITITPGEMIPPAQGVIYTRVPADEVVAGKQYIIATVVDGQYYALSAIEYLAYPYAPTGRLIETVSVGSSESIVLASCDYSYIEWGFEESCGYDADGNPTDTGFILTNRAPSNQLIANTHANIAIGEPYLECRWHLGGAGLTDGAGLYQSKIVQWRDLAYDVSGGYFTAINAAYKLQNGEQEDVNYSTDIYFFEKDAGSSPTPVPSTPVITTPPVPTTAPATTTPPVTTTPSIAPSSTPDVTPTAPIYQLGDVNMDGQINTGDAAAILRYTVGLIELTPEQLALGDFNGDGSVNTGDAAAVLQYSVGLWSR